MRIFWHIWVWAALIGCSLTTASPDSKFDPTRLTCVSLTGDTRFHHSATITSIEIFKDGKRALTTARDGTARIWDLDTGEELLRLYHEDAHDIWDALLIQNDKEVLTTGNHNSVVRWNLTTGKIIDTYDHKDTVFRVAISPDEKTLVSCDGSNIAIAFNLASGEEIFRLKGHKRSVYDLKFSRDGTRIITCSEDDSLRIWSAINGIEFANISPSHGDIYSIEPAPNTNKLLICTSQASIRMMDGGLDNTLWEGGLPDGVRTATWSHDGTRIAAICDNDRLYVLDAMTGKTLHDFELPGKTNYGVSFTQDDRHLICGCDYVLCRFDAETGARLFPESEQSTTFGPPGLFIDLKKQNLRFETLSSGGVAVRQRDTGQIKTTYLRGRDINTIAHSTKVGVLAAAGDDGTIWLLNPASGEELRTLPHGDDVNSIRITRNGETLISGGDDRKIKIWAIETGELQRTLEGHKASIRSMRVSRDQSHLASITSRTLNIWNLDTSTKVQTHEFKDESLSKLRFNPADDRSILLSGRDSLYYWPYPKSIDTVELDGTTLQAKILQLGALDFHDRVKATNELINYGKPVLPFIKNAEPVDPEVKHRINHIIRVIAGKNRYKIEDLFKLSLGDNRPGSLTWHPNGIHWATTEGSDAEAGIVFGKLNNGKLEIQHRIEDGHSPRILYFEDAHTLHTSNRDGSRAIYKIIP